MGSRGAEGFCAQRRRWATGELHLLGCLALLLRNVEKGGIAVVGVGIELLPYRRPARAGVTKAPGCACVHAEVIAAAEELEGGWQSPSCGVCRRPRAYG